MIKALVIFVLMYACMLIFPRLRVYAALGGAALMVALGVLPLAEVPGAVNWNVIMMISGTMGIVTLFIDSGMPARLADMMLKKLPNACAAIIAMAAFAGVVSAFVDNVATVLMIAPVGLAVAKKANMDPVPVIISIAVSSNLQGAATLVGDTTSILLGDYAGMSFADFIFWRGKFSIFWAVELGALATIPILYLLFRKAKQPVDAERITEVRDMLPTVLMVGVVLSLIAASFFTIPVIDGLKNGILCLAWCVVGVAVICLRRKDTSALKLALREMDYSTLAMLAGLFIVVAAISEAGLIDAIAGWFSGIGNGSVFLLYTLIVFLSVALSAFVDNIPYVAAMLPVVQVLAKDLGIDPVVMYFGLLTGATLGGNITPFGASANVAGIGILRKEGYTVKNGDFFRIGIPFTLTAVTVGYLFIWFVWG